LIIVSGAVGITIYTAAKNSLQWKSAIIIAISFAIPQDSEPTGNISIQHKHKNSYETKLFQYTTLKHVDYS